MPAESAHPDQFDTDTATPQPDRRSLDRLSLVGGVLAVLLAGLYLLDDLADLAVSAAGVTASVLAVLGVALVAAGLRRRTTPTADQPQPYAAPVPDEASPPHSPWDARS